MQVMALPWILGLFQSQVTALFATTPFMRVHLAQAPFNPTSQSQASDFTEASFAGYSPQVINTFGVVHLDAKNQPTTEGGSIGSFAPSGVLTTPQTIGGYWLEDQAGNYVLGEPFPNPVTVSTPLTPINFPISCAINVGQQQVVMLP